MYDEVKATIADNIGWAVQEMIDDLGTETETDTETDPETEPDTDPEVHGRVKEVIEELGDDWSAHADYTESISRHIAGRLIKMEKASLATLIGDVAFNNDPEEVHRAVCGSLKALDWAELKESSYGHVVEQVTDALRKMRE